MDAKGSPRGPTWAPTGASGAQMVPKDSRKAPKGSQAMAKGAGRGAKGGSNETHKNEKLGKGSLARLVGKNKRFQVASSPQGANEPKPKLNNFKQYRVSLSFFLSKY